ncbi:MAG: aminotransferase class V-fold PLP-dependent enzyme [Ruminococcus sp.]|nr:aminotransferase class V-fold PLP-dependent enzyme [Ruminococcus sp.]
MINFDNSATSFPKPASVRAAVNLAITKYGGNPGRGGHALSTITAEQVYNVRQSAAELFGAAPENTIFTANCTLALNMAIKGIMQYGGHIIISDHEHNAVFRPVYALAKTRGVTFSVLHLGDDDEQTLSELRRLIRNDTRCVCCTVASNVTGRISPYREIASLCKSYGLCFIADAAQAAGILDISLADGFDFICTAGHKALYGPSGTGLLISSGEYELSTIIEGGTGVASSQAEQPDFLPERLESGTVNTMGILGLGAGIDFVKSKTPGSILEHETALCNRLEQSLNDINGVKLYTCKRKVPILSFNVGELPSAQVCSLLSQRGFALRGGLHCAALTHRTLGTLDQGTIRFSPSVFNSSHQVDALTREIQRIKSKA